CRMPANRASRRREKRLLKNQRLAIFFLPEIFGYILNQLPLESLYSCLLVCRHWNLVVRSVLTRHPSSNYGQDPPWILSCDSLYSNRDDVKAVARHLKSHWMTDPVPSGKKTIEVVTSKRYQRLRYWETYAAACHDLAIELASLDVEEQEAAASNRAHDDGEDNSRHCLSHNNTRLPHPLTNGKPTSLAARYLTGTKCVHLRHLTLLNFGFMELLSPIPLIRVLRVEATLTSLTLRMSEHLERLYFSQTLQQRTVSGAELLFTLNSLPSLVHLEIESTHRLEKIVDTRMYYYLGRSGVSMDSLRQKISGDELPESTDWDMQDGYLLPDTPRRPHGLEHEVREYSRRWLAFLAGGEGRTARFKLRRLRLADVAVGEQQLLPILSCCPYLEELILDGICWHSTKELGTTLQHCPRLHTLRLLRIRQTNYSLCTDIIKHLPALRTLEMDEHDIDLFEYSPRSLSRRNAAHENNITAPANNHEEDDSDEDEDNDENGDSDDGDDDGDNGSDSGSSSDSDSDDGDIDIDNDDDDDDDDDFGEDISLRERHEAIRYYWRPVLQANRITRLVLTSTAETGRTLGQAHLHTIHCRHVMAIDLHNFLCLAPHLLHLEAPSTLLFEEMVLPKKIRYQLFEDSEARHALKLTADEHVARLLTRMQPPSSWVCHKLQTLKLSIWSESDAYSLASCDTSAIFGFLARTCPDLQHIALRRKAFALQGSLGFGLEELARFKRLRVLEMSVNSLVSFKIADVAWIFDKKKHKTAPIQKHQQHLKHQQQPTPPDVEKGGLFGQAMELFRIDYSTLLGGEAMADSKAVNKAFDLPFAFSIDRRGRGTGDFDKK
ncbi:hypothetical protein DFQ26_000440, partial [Actinomortierella ambigua]